MNHIKVNDMLTPYGYKENYWIIDGRSLPEYLDTWASGLDDDDLKLMHPFLGLCPAWSKRLDWKGDIRFVWKLIEMDLVVLPLLLCPDDLDFSCIVIVAEVEKTQDYVYWHKIGYVSHAMVKTFWSMEVQKQLENFSKDKVIDKEKCAYMIADITPGGKEILESHQKDHGEILLHLLVGDLISEPLIDLLKYHAERVEDIEMYCKAIEVMWRNGDDYVVNVVDVTILERLSDEECIWQRFGMFISDKFKEYINTEVLVNNLMMGSVNTMC